MKTTSFSQILAVAASILVIAAGCNSSANEEKTTETAKPDLAQVRAEIQALETEWAKASTAKDIAKVMSFYADDAVEMNDDEPMLIGKAAIEPALTKSMMERKPGTTVSFETMEVFGDGNLVTETGKIITKDAAGKVVSTGKYMGLFEKRDGKYICIRDISNEDQKGK